MNDILLTADLDLSIAGGDFALCPDEEYMEGQNIKQTVLRPQGSNRYRPESGVGIAKYQNAPTNPLRADVLNERIRQHLVIDGYTKIEVNATDLEDLTISASR